MDFTTLGWIVVGVILTVVWDLIKKEPEQLSYLDQEEEDE